MLEHLHDRVVRLLANVHTVTLSSSGPAGLQSSRLTCETSDIELYILIPCTSDHLLNLETQPAVVVVNEIWNMNGVACIMPRNAYPPALSLVRLPEIAWSKVLHIHPTRLNILRTQSDSPIETIDIG